MNYLKENYLIRLKSDIAETKLILKKFSDTYYADFLLDDLVFLTLTKRELFKLHELQLDITFKLEERGTLL